jgi:hypothetical protein
MLFPQPTLLFRMLVSGSDEMLAERILMRQTLSRSRMPSSLAEKVISLLLVSPVWASGPRRVAPTVKVNFDRCEIAALILEAWSRWYTYTSVALLLSRETDRNPNGAI